jgi:hypothetical protein
MGLLFYLPMKMKQTGCSETADTGESPRRKHSAFRTWLKYEIKNLQKELASMFVHLDKKNSI